MKTVDIVKTAKGCFVTRRYCGQNKGREFFTSVAPLDMKKTEAKKFLKEVEKAREAYIKEWVGE